MRCSALPDQFSSKACVRGGAREAGRFAAAALALMLGSAASPLAAEPAPELAVPAAVAPIVHQPYFQGERELFGYNPRFMPNTVTFDEYNRPYIRNSLEAGQQVIQNSDAADGGVVQTLDAQGNWIDLDFTGAIKNAFPHWDGIHFAGTFAEERIVFDSDGDAYMTVNAARFSNLGRNLLLYSTDKARSWQVYELPAGNWARLEVPDAHHVKAGPPTILTYNGWVGSPLSIVKPTKTAGGLSIGSPVQLVADPYAHPGPMQAGLGNATYTHGDTTYLTYLSLDPAPGYNATPQYIVSHNHTTGQTSAPVLLGINGLDEPDQHNGPVITMDSQGYIHAILGAHHNNFLYTRSLQPHSISDGWTTPVPIGHPTQSNGYGYYTYVSMVIDEDDTLHVVGRYAGDGYHFALDYLRKKADEPWWDNFGHLVMPFRAYYSTWDQKLTIDEQGRLFLRYSYFADQLDYEGGPEVTAYRAKWPDEPIELAPGSRELHGTWLGVSHHDPVILMSDDGGDTWRIALTSDFVSGVVPEPATTLYLAAAGSLLVARRRPRPETTPTGSL